MPGNANQRLDSDLTTTDIAALSTVDALSAFLTRLEFPTGVRREIPSAGLSLTPELTAGIRGMHLLAQDPEESLSVTFVQLRSLTAKARHELVRNLHQRGSSENLLILTRDFEALEFVLIDKERGEKAGPNGVPVVRPIPRVFSVIRKAANPLDCRILRRLTWTGKDGFEQFEKLRSVFQAAHFSELYFQNRALFADHYLVERLKADPVWAIDPGPVFREIRRLFGNARERWIGKDEQAIRDGLYEPFWKLLGFKARVNKAANKDHLEPDYVLGDQTGEPVTVAFTYRWDRWLDGPDLSDSDTPEENPGAAVVSTLTEGKARWAVVTNGKYWRLYSKEAHSRATNFYEVDLEAAFIESGETDPNEAFRYWWLFFRLDAFAPISGKEPSCCWLDEIVRGSRDYAKELGDRLKKRIFVQIFPHIAQGFLHDRRRRLGEKSAPTEADLKDIFEATLTLLYRLLFLLYAEARDLLPIRESPYRDVSLKKIKDEIADAAGIAETAVAERLEKSQSDSSTKLYDRLLKLFAVMDQGDANLNVPCYNGGLFLTQPDKNHDGREQRIAGFLLDHKVPDSFLAPAIDRLSRDPDEKTFGLVNIDYKSLEVRHLGSIYEGLLEFKLKVADEDLGVATEKKKEKYIPLSQVKAGRGKKAAAVVRKGEVYLSNDKADRKASGSYYTPDPIVEYIVEHTVGPVLEEKLGVLKPELDKAAKTYHRHIANAKANAGIIPKNMDARAFAEAKTYAEHRDLVEKIFDLKVLDPAMGSGHFLVEAVDFITDRLLDFLNRYPHNPVNVALDKTRRSIEEALAQQSVSVDTKAKLTDINLLKRHVLKRCIYGVDLNPMAVELAKVSLWLDAFTLGAPLSFLDHHLRCGNSLIGSTFDDLKKVTEGQLFSIDYEPLMRAIRHVLFVNEMADATAAEVHKSAEEYAQARRDLSGYKIVLDLLVADHFVGDGAKAKAGGRRRHTAAAKGSFAPSRLLLEAQEIDLSNREGFIASLDEKARKTVEQVEGVAERPDHRFFHWEIEFPEVYFGFIEQDRQQVKHKNRISDGSAGFDVVVGNPPYDVLSQKELGEGVIKLVEFFRNEPGSSSALGRKLNLYRLFISCSICRAHSTGRFGMIVPLGITGDLSASALRKELLERHAISSISAFPQKDDPRRRIFSEAKLSTCILLAGSAPTGDSFTLTIYPANELHSPVTKTQMPFAIAKTFDPVSYAIPLASEIELRTLQNLYTDPTIAPLATITHCYQGEVNLSTYKACLSTTATDAAMIKGVEIGRYSIRSVLRQGRKEYLKKDAFSRAVGSGAIRSQHPSMRRLVMQGITGVDDSRRLSATIVEPPMFCGHSVNYVVEATPYSLEALLVLLNSELLEWRFRLTSTNNNVNSYEIEALPIPFDSSDKEALAPASGRLKMRDVVDAAMALKESLPQGTAWIKMRAAHAFLSDYGHLRLRYGESDNAEILSANSAVNELIFAVYGVHSSEISINKRPLIVSED